MNNLETLWVFLIFIMLLAACKESYVPPVVSINDPYLVVEGFINNGPDTTRINLTHTFKLDDTANVTPEANAVVMVEGKGGDSHQLTESGNGLYIAPGLSLNAAEQYRLHILTHSGKQYASDYVDVKTSPPIDSISWKYTDQGVQIYANTHDPQNDSRYYRWEYNETWEFHSFYYSEFTYVNGEIEPRIPDTIYTCWHYNPSTTVLISSSAKLAQDEIYQFPLVKIPANSWEISVEYSILVKQYVVTPDAYAFWQNLQKNTEQIGSIFSPQPSEVRGNIHNLADSAEQVIGYISAGTLTQQRIFITPGQLPGWQGESYPDDCQETTIGSSPQILAYWLGDGLFLPVAPALSPGSYFIAPAICVDCRQSGTNVKPTFWP
jgi:hypothetical protein